MILRYSLSVHLRIEYTKCTYIYFTQKESSKMRFFSFGSNVNEPNQAWKMAKYSNMIYILM